MTGLYPSIPYPRMMLDRDGTRIFIADAGFTAINAQATTAEIKAAMDDNPSSGSWYGGSGGINGYLLMFPERRDIQAMFIAMNGFYGPNIPANLKWSVNTTNGVDGTWTSVTYAGTAGGANAIAARNNIWTASIPNISALRFTGSDVAQSVNYLHLYGKYTSGSNPNRLEFWHPTLDQSLNSTPDWLDWGDRPRSTVASKTVRVKNLSSTLTATSIVVGVEALTDTTPAMVSQHDLSLDGTTFSPTLTLSSLAPGQISAPIIIRQSLLSSTVLSLWTQRLAATAGAWS